MIESGKNNILSQLKRITPGASTSIGAIEKPNGDYATDPDSIAQELSTHWRKTFKKKPIDKQLLKDWLTLLYPPSSPNPHHLPGTRPGEGHPAARQPAIAVEAR